MSLPKSIQAIQRCARAADQLLTRLRDAGGD